MESLPFALTFLAALGAGLIGGLFFAFFVFRDDRPPPPSATGISAMQSINVAVLNPLFFAAALGLPLSAFCWRLPGLSDGRSPMPSI